MRLRKRGKKLYYIYNCNTVFFSNYTSLLSHIIIIINVKNDRHDAPIGKFLGKFLPIGKSRGQIYKTRQISMRESAKPKHADGSGKFNT